MSNGMTAMGPPANILHKRKNEAAQRLEKTGS
jgi:hypothetical protein